MLFYYMLFEQSVCAGFDAGGVGWWKLVGEVAVVKCDSCVNGSEVVRITSSSCMFSTMLWCLL
jgi:hypothetical protein